VQNFVRAGPQSQCMIEVLSVGPAFCCSLIPLPNKSVELVIGNPSVQGNEGVALLTVDLHDV
jgi:hypothetical protein